MSWGYYVATGNEPDCRDDAQDCVPHQQNAKTPGIWNPLPSFTTVQQDGQLGNIQPTDSFLAAAKAGTLPAVSWITPDQTHSEHPPAKISDGQAYVTILDQRRHARPDWNSTAIFLGRLRAMPRKRTLRPPHRTSQAMERSTVARCRR